MQLFFKYFLYFFKRIRKKHISDLQLVSFYSLFVLYLFCHDIEERLRTSTAEWCGVQKKERSFDMNPSFYFILADSTSRIQHISKSLTVLCRNNLPGTHGLHLWFLADSLNHSLVNSPARCNCQAFVPDMGLQTCYT